MIMNSIYDTVVIWMYDICESRAETHEMKGFT